MHEGEQHKHSIVTATSSVRLGCLYGCIPETQRACRGIVWLYAMQHRDEEKHVVVVWFDELLLKCCQHAWAREAAASCSIFCAQQVLMWWMAVAYLGVNW